MSRAQLLFLCLVGVCLVLATHYLQPQPALALPPQGEGPYVQRFRIQHIEGTDTKGVMSSTFLLDTETGRVWKWVEAYLDDGIVEAWGLCYVQSIDETTAPRHSNRPQRQ